MLFTFKDNALNSLHFESTWLSNPPWCIFFSSKVAYFLTYLITGRQSLKHIFGGCGHGFGGCDGFGGFSEFDIFDEFSGFHWFDGFSGFDGFNGFGEIDG